MTKYTTIKVKFLEQILLWYYLLKSLTMKHSATLFHQDCVVGLIIIDWYKWPVNINKHCTQLSFHLDSNVNWFFEACDISFFQTSPAHMREKHKWKQ